MLSSGRTISELHECWLHWRKDCRGRASRPWDRPLSPRCTVWREQGRPAAGNAGRTASGRALSISGKERPGSRVKGDDVQNRALWAVSALVAGGNKDCLCFGVRDQERDSLFPSAARRAVRSPHQGKRRRDRRSSTPAGSRTAAPAGRPSRSPVPVSTAAAEAIALQELRVGILLIALADLHLDGDPVAGTVQRSR